MKQKSGEKKEISKNKKGGGIARGEIGTVLPRSHHELHLVISLPVPYHTSPADVPVRVRRVTEKRCFDERESGNQQWTHFF